MLMTPSPEPPLRIGHGYDLHRLEPTSPEGRGRPFILAGVRFEHPRGPVSHSDGDAVYHAAADAVLGALGIAEIGELFPDTDPRNESADSARFVGAAAKRMLGTGYVVGNLDVTVICERPRITPAKQEMIGNLARHLECDRGRINIKGKTHEEVDAVGEGRAVEVHAVVLLERRG